jgi:hypothetical protein
MPEHFIVSEFMLITVFIKLTFTVINELFVITAEISIINAEL